MKPKKLIACLTVMALLVVTAGLSSCDSNDGVDASICDSTFKISYLEQDPDQNKQQGYRYGEEYIELIPQKEPPYLLMVKWDSNEGRKAIDYIIGKKDVVTLNREDSGEKGRAIISSNKYISCSNLYISSSYKAQYNYNMDGDYIWIDCMVLVKIKKGKSVEKIAKAYSHALKNCTVSSIDVMAFDCTFKTSYEVVRLTEEISQLDDVEWAAPNMWNLGTGPASP